MRLFTTIAVGGLLALSVPVGSAFAAISPPGVSQEVSPAPAADITPVDWNPYWRHDRHREWRHEWRERWHPEWHHHWHRYYNGYRPYGY